MTRVLITVHNETPSAVTATESTLQQLPGGGMFARTADGAFERVGRKFVLVCSQPDFVLWAAVRQGYVLAAELEGG